MAAVTAASYAGAAFAFAVTPGLVSEFGWSSAFYSFGAIALFWIPIWLAMQASDSNEQSKGDESRRLMSTDASVSEATSMEIWRELWTARLLA